MPLRCILDDKHPCKASEIKIFVGILNANDTQTSHTYYIKRFTIHPWYNSSARQDYKNDISLIQLNNTIVFEEYKDFYQTNAICLPDINDRIEGQEYALISGYGKTNPTYYPHQLQIGWTVLSHNLGGNIVNDWI